MLPEMERLPENLLVDAAVLPEVFVKVVQAKRLLAKGRARSVSEAVKLTGISRSAFYKYKDHVHWFDEQLTHTISTYYVSLEDEPGVLSSVLSAMYRAGGNVLTINQNIPVDGVAPVTITARVDGLAVEEPVLLERLRELPGVVAARKISAQ